ncbi:NUDIX domain-containing protein [Streptomyces geranii]|uniref:NUDIX domain-containing protein n=1 Tax=Streptomyces geranii TaxID=2058923 RepID=UPI000D04194B|nr:NUDIX domain-containing protein [Streptomyces geranii]
MVIVVGRVIDQVTVEAAVTDAHLASLLGRHRVRGWVPPGGKVEPGETPRTAAARELAEEAGVASELLPVPAAMAVRSLR